MIQERKLKIGDKIVSTEEVYQPPPPGTAESVRIMSSPEERLTETGKDTKAKLLKSAKGLVTRRLTGTVACISGSIVAVRKRDGTIEHATYDSCRIVENETNDDEDDKEAGSQPRLPGV